LKVNVVLPGLPAAIAGLREGDFVIELNGDPLVALPEDRAHESALQEKGALDVKVRRGGATIVARLVRLDRPSP